MTYSVLILRVFLISAIICMPVFFIFDYSVVAKRMEVKNKAHTVTVKISYLPPDCTTSTEHFRILFQNNEYGIPLKNKVCNLKQGDILEFLHDERYPEIFLFPDEQPQKELSPLFGYIISFIAAVVALICYWDLKE